MKTGVRVTVPRLEVMAGFGKSQRYADGMTQVGRIYAADMKRRFALFSRGGGDWAPLALSTVAARRGKKISKRDRLALTGRPKVRRGSSDLMRRLAIRLAVLKHKGRIQLARDTRNGGSLVMAGKNYSILWDKDGSLYKALDIGAPGNVMELRGNTLTYGIRGGAKAGAKITIGRLAAIHHNGNANLPARRILDVPSVQANDRIRDTLVRSVTAYIRERIKRK